MGYITHEQFSKENSRSHRKDRAGSTLRSEEKLKIGNNAFSRIDKGKWVAQELPSGTKVARVSDDPANERELDASIKPFEAPIK